MIYDFYFILRAIINKSDQNKEIIKEVASNTVEDMEKNVTSICSWIDQFINTHK